MWKALQHVNLGCDAVEAVMATRASWASVTQDSAGVAVEPSAFLAMVQVRVVCCHTSNVLLSFDATVIRSPACLWCLQE